MTLSLNPDIFAGGASGGSAMRPRGFGLALIGMATALSGCVAVYGDSSGIRVARVDPEDAAERALTGAVVGTALGTGIGSVFSINPAIGAVVGAESGATLGAGVGALTAQPIPDYAPIVVPQSAVIPGFYDTWPPGNRAPSTGTQVPPPRG
jgi:hypothetical protein